MTASEPACIFIGIGAVERIGYACSYRSGVLKGKMTDEICLIETIKEIKKTALEMTDARRGLAHIIRLCIDAEKATGTWVRIDDRKPSPVTHNPQDDAFYERAEADAREKGQR